MSLLAATEYLWHSVA